MEKKKIICLLGSLIFLVGALFFVNRDLMHFEYRFPYERNFDPEVDTKGIHLITGELTLRPGNYQLEMLGNMSGNGSSWLISDLNGEVIAEEMIVPGSENLRADVSITDPRPMRIGVRYEPDGGSLNITEIRLTSDQVLYKDSLTRHAFISALIILVVVYGAAHICVPKKFEAIQTRECVVFYLLLIALLASLPMFDPKVSPFGDDLMFHLSRIDGVAATLKAGIFPTKIYLSWMQNYGVGSGLFYPDLFITIPAAFSLLGFSLVTCCKIFYFICSFFSGLTAYMAAKRMSGGKRSAGLIAASLYVFASYRLICIYYRQALGEVQAFVFYPLIIYGAYEILRGNTKKWLWFAFGFWGLLCTHLISVAIAGFVTAAYLIFCLPRILRNKKILGALVLSVLAVVLAGAFFLLPMIEQYGKVDLYLTKFFDDPDSTVGSLHFMQAKTLLKVFDNWLCDGTGDHPYPGWPLLAAFVLCFVPTIRRRKDEVSVPNRMLLLALVTLFASTETFPWRFFHWFIFRIQFSWRFLTMSTVLLVMCTSLYLSIWLEEQKEANFRKLVTLACVVPFLFGAPLLVEAYLHHTQPVVNLSMEDKEISGAEYMPVALDTSYVYRNRDTVQSSDASVTILSRKRSGLSFRFSYDGAAEGTDLRFEVPLIYYYGYQAEYENEVGEKTALETFAGPNGLVSVDVSGSPKGSIWVGYRLTPVQKISYACSLATILGCAAWAFLQKRKDVHEP